MRPLVVLAAMAVLGMTAGPVPGQSVADWTLDPIHRIGGAAASDDLEVFEGVMQAGLGGRADTLLVLDTEGHRVLHFGPQGRAVRAVGREGGGPGEFRFPTAMAVDADGAVVVFDGGTQRYTRFPRDGRPVTTAAPVRTYGRLRVDSEGGFLQALASVSAVAGETRDGPELTRIVRVDPRDGTVRPVLVGPAPRRETLQLEGERGMVRTRVREIFGLETRWDLLSNGALVVSDTAAYVLKLLDPDGGIRARFGPGTEAATTTDADRAAALAALEAELVARNETRSPAFRRPRAFIEEIVARTPVNERIPVVSGVIVDDADRIWVGVGGAADGPPDRIDIYDSTGVLVARVARPPAFPDAIYGDRAAVLERDELGALQVVVYSVQPNGAA